MEQLRKEFNWTKRNELMYMSVNVSVKTRKALMVDFNDMESEAKVMLAWTKVCGEGITLFGVSRVVLLDVVCNPSVQRQAIGPAYRIGQQKIVHTNNLIGEENNRRANMIYKLRRSKCPNCCFQVSHSLRSATRHRNLFPLTGFWNK